MKEKITSINGKELIFYRELMEDKHDMDFEELLENNGVQFRLECLKEDDGKGNLHIIGVGLYVDPAELENIKKLDKKIV
ncbi:hypothetical protein [Cetobacterium sp.]|uniref:hypothetical protein n=1 Tax=Cetobacterium sp. TaxID=2071632 RepID=UPI003F2BAEDD